MPGRSSRAKPFAVAVALALLAGCRAAQQAPAQTGPAPAPPARLGLLLGNTHVPLLELHGVDPKNPAAVGELAKALTGSDLIRLTNPELRSGLLTVGANSSSVPELVRVAEQLSRERRYGVASLFLDHALAVDPQNADVLSALGDALVAFERPSLAIEAYDRAAALRPESAAVWEKLARACLAEGRLRKARRAGPSLRDALVKVRDLAADPKQKGWAETCLLRLDMVEDTYTGPAWDKVGSDGKPLGIGPLRLRTNAAFEKGLAEREAAKRVDLFAEAVRADAGLAAAHFNLALALLDAGRYEEAVPYFEETRRLAVESGDVSVAEAMAGQALCHANLKQTSEADALARAAVSAGEDSPYARYVLARVTWLAGDSEGAKGRCLEALARWPEHAGALDLLGDCFLRSRDTTLAERAWKYAAWAEASPEKRAEIQVKLHDLPHTAGRAAPSSESPANTAPR